MKTKKVNIKLLFAVCLIILLNIASFGQNSFLIKKKTTLSVEQTKPCNMLNFSGQEYEGKLFFNLTVSKDETEGIFVLEKTENGIHYSDIKAISNVPTGVDLPIIYSFVVDSLPSANTAFRLVKYTLNGIEELGAYDYRTSPQQEIFVDKKKALKNPEPLFSDDNDKE